MKTGTKKKQVPKTPSLIVKEDTLYSIPWKPVKIIANKIVNNEPYKAPSLLPWIILWCAYVTVAPLDNRITVFSRGNSNGFIGYIPKGGHWAPNSTVGDNALWK